MRLKFENRFIEKALGGDAEAFSDIYFALRGSVYGFAYRMLRDVSASEDVTQEVFMFLLNNPKKFDAARGELPAFLCGVARKKVIQHLRKHSTKFEIATDETSDFDNAEILSRNALDDLLDKELNEKIEEITAELPFLQREVLILREVEELSYAEIAEITETNLGQVKIRIHRARKYLANRLKPYLKGQKEKYYEMH